jgi:ABC-type multidrug transport system fused ATPase/permease subunit
MLSTGVCYIIGAVISGSAVLLMLQVGDHTGGNIGLVVTYTFALAFFLQLLSTIVTAFLTFITSLERMLQCLKEVPQEPSWESAEDKDLLGKWPPHGMVDFRKVSLVYRPGLPTALEEVSFIIPAGSSAGIVGRTGSGKSSLLVLLFRIVEAASGNIFIDGVNIATVGLHVLRKGMAIIPQEPLLFDGSVRSNVDPFGDKNDEEIACVCASVGLLGHKTQAETSELSAGERQLVSLARVLLQHAKIVTFDEPTANIDLATDKKVQQTFQNEFKGSTTLTIAHRLETIINCDKIIVMDAGTVVESGRPQDLLADASSTFALMARKHGGIDVGTDPSSFWL